jgi:glutamate N-acetyltransferase/amino-acid N-acetyltransferase
MDSTLTDTHGVTYARGYRAGAINCGIRKERLDLALIVSDTPATAGGVFTRNLCCAAPVALSRRNINADTCRAILVNSGNANAATGEPGYQAALLCAEETATKLGCAPTEVLVASTGIIGVPLPHKKIVDGLDKLIAALAPDGGDAVSQAILTTDLVRKQCACEIKVGKGIVRIGGVAKGSGMIMPNMGTMLCFITTDAALSRHRVQRLLAKAADVSFNRITVDGDTSTNDCVILLANGASGVTVEGADEAAFLDGLTRVCTALAQMIVRDGEGATKFVTITAEGCATEEGADAIARTVANSPLVKTALCGCNPNWGRIIAAAGRAGVAFDPAKIDVFINDVIACKNGGNAGTPKPALDAAVAPHDIEIRIVFAEGTASATVWTCDFSHKYIDINVDYS